MCFQFKGRFVMLLQRLSDDSPKEQDDLQEMRSDDNVIATEMLMILSSRPQNCHIGDRSEIRQSVINYGVSDLFPAEISKSDRNAILEKRIFQALQLFEPRLKKITVTAENESYGCSLFIIEAEKNNNPVRYYLEWDDILSYFSLRS